MSEHIHDCQLGSNWRDCPACVANAPVELTARALALSPREIATKRRQGAAKAKATKEAQP